MEKLIELLNQYEREITLIPVCWNYDKDTAQYGSYLPQISKVYLISKHYGFIEWLVKNDKIDFNKTEVYQLKEIGFSDFEGLLMLLSIKDNPILFLLDVLKDVKS